MYLAVAEDPQAADQVACQVVEEEAHQVAENTSLHPDLEQQQEEVEES